MYRHHYGDSISVEKRMASLEPLPKVRGPKLGPFASLRDLKDIEFVRLLSVEDDHSPGSVPHSRVFQVEIGGAKYALKVVSPGI
jgi:hypothetical protein